MRYKAIRGGWMCGVAAGVILFLGAVTVAEAADSSGSETGTAAATETGQAIERPADGTLERSWFYGLSGGLYSNGGRGFLGGGVVLPLNERVSFNPSGDWLFVDAIDRMFTLNADLHFDVPLEGRTFSWIGAGVGVRHFAKGDGWPPEHSLGLNLLGGIGFGRENGVTPIIQGKVFFAGDTLFANDTEFVLSAGVRF